MTVAIVCPKYPMNNDLIGRLVEERSGELLKIIGTKKKIDPHAYEKVIIVYRCSLSSDGSDLIGFLKNNSNLKNVSMVMDASRYSVEKYPDLVHKIIELITFFNSVYNKERIAVTVNDPDPLEGWGLNEFSEKLGVVFMNCPDKTDALEHPVTIVFTKLDELNLSFSETRINLYVALAIIAAVPVVATVTYLTEKWWLALATASLIFGWGSVKWFSAHFRRDPGERMDKTAITAMLRLPILAIVFGMLAIAALVYELTT